MFLKSQRNQLLQELINQGLQPSDFSESTESKGYRINCKRNLNFFFFITDSPSRTIGSYEIIRKPGNWTSFHNSQTMGISSWRELLENLGDWASSVKEEVEIPDLWLDSIKAVQLFESANDPANDKFTISELGALHGQLRMLAQLFETSELLREHQAELAELTQTAAVKAESFTKKDWQNWVKGAFISAIVSLGLSEEQSQELLALVRLAFGGLFLKH